MPIWTPIRVLSTMLLGGPSAHLVCCSIRTLTGRSRDFYVGTLPEMFALCICWLVFTALTFAVTYQALTPEVERAVQEKKSIIPIYFKAFEIAFLLELVLHGFHK